MAPIVHGLEDLYADQINFVYLDVDDPATNAFKSQLGYRYQPEYYLIGPDGSTLQVWFGFAPPEAFMEVFDNVLSN